MNKLHKGSIKKNITRNIVLFIMFLSLLPVLVAGYTQSVVIPPGGWFTDEAVTGPNIFVAGTVIIDAENTGSGSYTAEGITSGLVVLPSGYYQAEYLVHNTGTKSIYLRAYFDGYWKKIYHKNTATVTAKAPTAGGQTISASDAAYFYFNNPSQNPSPSSGQTVGFTDKDYSVAGPEITFGSFTPPDPGNGSGNGGNDNGGGEGPTGCNPADFSTWPERNLISESPPLSGRDILPYYFSDGGLPAGDPHPNELVFPEGCTVVYYSKQDQTDIGSSSGITIKFVLENGMWVQADSVNQASLNFYQAANGYASFGTENKDVFHAYAKGGPGGHLYSYPNGVGSDCWLTQPRNNYNTGSISHLSIYYCEKPAKPDISIKKYVFLGDYDNNENPIWLHITDGFEMELKEGVTPQFKIVVTNTGQVDLVDVIVEDNVLDLTDGSKTWYIGTLGAGVTVELIIDNISHWWEEQLSTEDINIKLCDNQDWLPQGEQILPVYFYYNHKITKDTSVPLCVKVYLKPGSEDRYNGSVFVLNSYYEAVQASHPEIMVDVNWLGHPIDTD